MAEKAIRRTTGKGGNYRKTKSGAPVKLREAVRLLKDVNRIVLEAWDNSRDLVQKLEIIQTLE